jgi:hypothetical protein
VRIRSRGAGFLTLGLVLLAAAGCASRHADWVFEVRAANAPARVAPGADDTVLLDVVASVITHELGLPLPARVPAYAYADASALADGLVRHGIAGERASQAARLGAAVATRAGIFLRSDLLPHMSTSERLRLFAHELAHIAQGELAGGRAPMWIREGHADWVAFRVIARLGGRPYAHLREGRRLLLLGSRTPPAELPALDELETGEAWVQAVQRHGAAAIYGQAFLAVDWLIERYTERLILSFFRGLGSPGRGEGVVDLDRHYWSPVFPLAYPTFVAEFRAYLRALP